jgi:hypothetical protein
MQQVHTLLGSLKTHLTGSEATPAPRRRSKEARA